jgi:hypothetical protein
MNEVHRSAASSSQLTPQQRDLQHWKREWLIWLIASAVLTAIWGVRCLIAAELRFFWPVWAIGIWFLLVALAPLLPSRRSSSGDSTAA